MLKIARVFTLPGVLLLALSAPALGAEENAEESAKESVKKSTEESANTEVIAQPVSVAKKKPAPKIRAQSAESADSYEASEEVSEDLAVSYPVDI
ncbi:hypothetical protein M0G74_14530 [Microbulbifer sp. CAU 1566]|uniref:hypothetical protein n=1 Tax=Microbulbifer sp. CAU 1566 TaxID=2933269 RepID=UPI0020051686|nr:hypothetical protein [Microbulbifer sp. CAU 1566]MCK7598494.1 hypothetical protein [Microbulbifer sp. CAU 1566]